MQADTSLPTLVYESDDGQIVTLGSDGNVVARFTPPAQFRGSFASVNGTLFITNADGQMMRVDAGVQSSCGAVPSVPVQFNGATSSLLLLERQTKSETVAFVSRDGCRTFTRVSDTPDRECTPEIVGPDALGCQGGNRVPPMLLDANGRWQQFAPVEGCFEGGALGPGAREVVCMDSGSDVGSPQGWPAVTAIEPTAVPRAWAAAFAWVNQRFRRPLGLPDLGWSTVAAKAARNHAAYLSINPTPHALSAHFEQRGKKGFTGFDPYARCAAAGGSCNGEVISWAGSVVGAIQQWLGTPGHGPPFVQEASFGCAAIKGNYVCDYPNAPATCHFELDAPPNTPTSSIHVWPANGTRNVPLSWSGGEIPQPFDGYRGNKGDAGPTILVNAAQSVRVQLDGPAGPVPLYYPFWHLPSAQRSLTAGTWFSPRNGLIYGPGGLIPARRLRPHARYTITVESVEPQTGKSYKLSFTTAG